MAEKEGRNVFDLKDLLRYGIVVLRHWYLLGALSVIFGVLAYLYIHKAEDRYECSSQILLKSTDTYDYQTSLMKGLGATSSPLALYEHIASQMRVVKSSSILNEVLDKLDLDVSYFIIGRLKTTEVFSHVPFRVTSENFDANEVRLFRLRVLDEQRFDLEFGRFGETKTIEGRFGELIFRDGVFLTVERTSAFNAGLLEQIRDINYEFRINNRAQLLAEYQNNLHLENIEYTAIVTITLEDNVPERVEMFLDTLSAVYIDYSLQSRVDVNENTLLYINKQIDEVTEILNSIGDEMEGYKRDRSILNLDREEDLYFTELVQTEQDIAALELSLTSINDLLKYVSELDENDVNLPPSIIMPDGDETATRLINDLYALHTQRLESSGFLSENNPDYINLIDKIELMRGEIVSYLIDLREAVNARLMGLNRTKADYENRLRFVPTDHRELLNIEKRFEVNEQLYSFLVSRRAETIIAGAAIVPEIKVIEAPNGSVVVYPNRRQFVLNWLLIGLGVGVVLALLKALMFDRIETIDQLMEATSFPVLGMIPDMESEPDYLFSDTNVRSRVYEAFRSLRANLEFLGANKANKVVMVTSLNPGEGKTFTAVNTAFIISRTKKRVLLIDCDLHKPKVNRAFNIAKIEGLSNCLVDGSGIAANVHRWDDHLDVLFSGPIPPNASELVASDAFRSLIAQARTQYDVVVIDTPPIGLITDALIMMSLVDIKLFIVNSKSTTKRTVRFIEEIVDRSDKTGSAMVLNRGKRPFSRYYYGSYRYYYGYGGYGYGYGGQEDIGSRVKNNRAV